MAGALLNPGHLVRSLALILAVGSLLGPARGAIVPGPDTPEPWWDPETVQKLQTLRVNVHWQKEVDVPTALHDLSKAAERADPVVGQIAFSFVAPKDGTRPDMHGQIFHPTLKLVRLDHPSVYEVLRAICRQTNLEMEVSHDQVVLHVDEVIPAGKPKA
jgi:hypothetical protein